MGDCEKKGALTATAVREILSSNCYISVMTEGKQEPARDCNLHPAPWHADNNLSPSSSADVIDENARD